MSGTNSLIVCTDSANTDLFTGTAFYLPLLGNSTGRTYSSPNAITQIPVNVGLTFSNLGVRANTNTFSGGSTAVLNFQKNASTVNQSVVCTGAGVGWISDATHSDTLAANDTYNTAFVTNSGGPDFRATIFQAQVNNSSPNVPYGFNNGGTTNAFTGSTRYTHVFGTGAAGQTAENNIVQSQAEAAGTLAFLAINITVTSSATFTAHSRVGGSNGNQTLSMTTLGVHTDATHTDSIAAGNLIDTSFVATGGTPTASFITYNFAGTTSQHDIGTEQDSSGSAISSGSTAYFFFGGNYGTAITTESFVTHVLPYALTATQLRINIQTWTETSTLVSRKSGPANGNQSVSVTSTGWTGDATHSDVFAANAVVSSKYTQGAGGTNNINAVLMSVDDGSNTGAPPYVPPPTHKPPKPPKPPKVGKPGPKGKPKNYNVDSTGLAATAYRRELAAIQRRHVVPGGIIYTLASGNAAGVGAATAFSQYGLLSVGAAAGVGAASAVSANLALSIASAIGAGAASGVGTGGTFAVGTVAGVGAAGGVTNYNALSVGTAAGIGAAFGISPTLMYAVGQSAGAGGAFGVTSVIAFSAGMAAGAARVRAIGVMQGRVLPFDIDRAWAIDINGSIIDAVQYDPITMVLRVIYVVPLVIDVGGMPYSITNTIGSSPDPQAYVLGLVASAVN